MTQSREKPAGKKAMPSTLTPSQACWPKRASDGLLILRTAGREKRGRVRGRRRGHHDSPLACNAGAHARAPNGTFHHNGAGPGYAHQEACNAPNKVSTALLNVLGAAGTNIIVENGTGADQQVPHLAFNVIPRVEGDGLNFQWQPKKLSDEQMGLIELQLKEQAKDVGVVPE